MCWGECHFPLAAAASSCLTWVAKTVPHYSSFPKIGVVISVLCLIWCWWMSSLPQKAGAYCLHANNLWWPMLLSTLWFQELRGGANNFLGTGFMEECRVRVSWEVVGSCTDLCRNLVIPTSNSGVHCKTSIVEVFKRGKPDDFLSWRLVWACVTSVTWQLWVECVCVCLSCTFHWPWTKHEAWSWNLGSGAHRLYAM